MLTKRFTKRINIPMTEPMREQVEQLAVSEGITLVDVCRKAIEFGLKHWDITRPAPTEGVVVDRPTLQ